MRTVFIVQIVGLITFMAIVITSTVLHYNGVYDAMIYYYDFGPAIASVIAYFISTIPVGSYYAYYAAVDLWQWQPLWAFVVFLWYVPVLLLMPVVWIGVKFYLAWRERSSQS